VLVHPVCKIRDSAGMFAKPVDILRYFYLIPQTCELWKNFQECESIDGWIVLPQVINKLSSDGLVMRVKLLTVTGPLLIGTDGCDKGRSQGVRSRANQSNTGRNPTFV